MKTDAENLMEFIGNYDSVYRFSRNHLLRGETLLQHIGVVSIICLYIHDKLEEQNIHMEPYASVDLLSSALVHDMEEIITGDIVRPTKYHSDALLKLIRVVENEGADTVIKKFNLPKPWKELWETAKTKQRLGGWILSIADTMAVILTCHREINLNSNQSFRIVAEECIEHVNIVEQEIKKEIQKTPVWRPTLTYLLGLLQDSKKLLEKGVGDDNRKDGKD